ncbi:hypothetical protein EK904_005577 [Melospiza melodia maxima]|nr:hypothetical protein EK904_005577 [Melospiza melodia maxima]
MPSRYNVYGQKQFKPGPPNEDGGVRTSRVGGVSRPGPGFGGSCVKMNPDCVRLNVRFELVGADGITSHKVQASSQNMELEEGDKTNGMEGRGERKKENKSNKRRISEYPKLQEAVSTTRSKDQ